MQKRKAAILCNNLVKLPLVYSPETMVQIRELVDLREEVVTDANIADTDLSDVEMVFSTWGMLKLTEEQIRAKLPNLKIIFYGAGATEGFVRPFLHCGVECSSAWQANAIPVAEFTMAQILLGLKGYHQITRKLHEQGRAAWSNPEKGPGAFGARVGLIGDGAIARRVQNMLAACRVEVILVPTIPEQRTVSLEEVFRTCQVVSNHLPNRDDNVNTITQALLESMPHLGVFLNTGRGRQLDHDGLVAALRNRPDLTSILDVTFPEPLPEGHPLYSLPKSFLTSHIAGSLNDECKRMGEYMLDELKRYLANQPMQYLIIESLLIP
ncbi:MAG: hydroxyacid dehydrogenase [Victivallales bacterium]|nr:hydroxyacid dehydrogenase [Victivallales bacterium]